MILDCFSRLYVCLPLQTAPSTQHAEIQPCLRWVRVALQPNTLEAGLPLFRVLGPGSHWFPRGLAAGPVSLPPISCPRSASRGMAMGSHIQMNSFQRSKLNSKMPPVCRLAVSSAERHWLLDARPCGPCQAFALISSSGGRHHPGAGSHFHWRYPFFVKMTSCQTPLCQSSLLRSPGLLTPALQAPGMC